MGAKIRLNGNLGDDPKAGKTNEGKPYVSFSVYQPHWVNTGNKNAEGRDEYDDNGGFWMNVTWFNRKAEKAAQILRKGAAVLIEGDMRVEYWTDKETGEYKSQWKVIADEVTLDFRSLETVAFRRREQYSNSTPPPQGNRHQPARGENSTGTGFEREGHMGSMKEGSLLAGSFETGSHNDQVETPHNHDDDFPI